MAVLVCRVVFQVFPLTQLPPRTDCQTVIEPLQLAFELIDERLVRTQNATGPDSIVEQVPDQLLRIRNPRLPRSVFGRPFVRGHQLAVIVDDQPVEPEPAGRLHHRIGLLFKIIALRIEQVFIPDVHAIPRIGRAVPVPVRITKNIILRLERPAPAVELACHLFPRIVQLRFIVNVAGKRLVALGQISRFCRPVIHLHVDIRVDVALPGRRVAVVPQPLQVRRQVESRPGRSDGQVTSVLEIKHIGRRIVLPFAVTNEKLIGRKFRSRIADIQGEPVIQCMIIVQVRFPQRGVSFGTGTGRNGTHLSFPVRPCQVVRRLGIIIRPGAQQQRRGIGSGQRQRRISGL